MWQLMQATSSTFQNTLRADFHHPYFVTPVSCLKRPKESRAPQISKNMCLLLIQQPSKTDIWGLPLCVIQPCNSLHLLCWQEDIKSQIESPFTNKNRVCRCAHLCMPCLSSFGGQCCLHAVVVFWTVCRDKDKDSLLCLNARQLQKCQTRPHGFFVTNVIVFSSNILKIEGILSPNAN